MFQVLDGITYHLEVEVTWGAAQNSLEVWNDTGNRWKGKLLDLNGLDAAHTTHPNGFESAKEL